MQRWNDFWFITGPAHALALLRITLGIYLLIRWSIWSVYVPLFFSAEAGMYFPFAYPPDGKVQSLYDLTGLLTAYPSVEQAWILYVLTMLGLLGMTLGYRTHLALGVYLATSVYHYFLYLHMPTFSFDRLVFIIAGIMIFSPCGKALSMDAVRARNQGKPFAEQQELWTQRLLCVLIAAMYFGTGVFKLTSPAWTKGEILSTAFTGEWSTFVSLFVARLHLPEGVWDLTVILVKLYELSAGLLLFHPRWQRSYMVVGFLFHFGNAVLLNIWQFMFVPLTYVIFFDAHATRRRVERLLQSTPWPQASPPAQEPVPPRSKPRRRKGRARR